MISKRVFVKEERSGLHMEYFLVTEISNLDICEFEAKDQ